MYIDIDVHTNTSDVCAGRAEAKVLLLYTASHEFACLARGGHCDICVITCLNFYLQLFKCGLMP